MPLARVVCSVVAALAGVGTVTGCAVQQWPVDGAVVEKVYAPGCTTDEIMSTASGPLTFDRTHAAEWFVVVDQGDAHPARVLVSEDKFNTIEVGDTYTANDHVWPMQPSECEENHRVES